MYMASLNILHVSCLLALLSVSSQQAFAAITENSPPLHVRCVHAVAFGLAVSVLPPIAPSRRNLAF
jgi:hypothetical protein